MAWSFVDFPSTASARPADRAQHGGVRRADAGARAGAAAAATPRGRFRRSNGTGWPDRFVADAWRCSASRRSDHFCRGGSVFRACASNASLDRLKSTTPAAGLEARGRDSVRRAVATSTSCSQEGPASRAACCEENERFVAGSAREAPDARDRTRSSTLLPSARAQSGRPLARIRVGGAAALAVLASLDRRGRRRGFPSRHVRSPFAATGCPVLSTPHQGLTFEDFSAARPRRSARALDRAG